MSNKSNKLVVGCGIGCGVIVLLLIIIGVVVYTFFKNVSQDIDKIDQANEVLESRYGKVTEFIIPTEIDDSRLNLFFDIRKKLNKKTTVITESFSELDSSIANDDNVDKSFWEVIGLINTGVDMIPELIEYYSFRSAMLLDKDMSLGEYYYYYVTTYISYKKVSLTDGPHFNLFDFHKDNQVNWSNEKTDTDEYIEEVKYSRQEHYKKAINKTFRVMLSNSIVNSQGDVTIFDTELKKLENDFERIPWEDGLPALIQSKYKAVDQLINSTYNSYLNPIELRNIKY